MKKVACFLWLVLLGACSTAPDVTPSTTQHQLRVGGPTVAILPVHAFWSYPDSKADAFAIQYGQPGSVTVQEQLFDGGTNRTGIINTLTAGNSYYFQLFAIDRSGLRSEAGDPVYLSLKNINELLLQVWTATNSTGPWSLFTNWPALRLEEPEGKQFFKLSIAPVVP